MNPFTCLLQISSDTLTNSSVFSPERTPYIIVLSIIVAFLTASVLFERARKAGNIPGHPTIKEQPGTRNVRPSTPPKVANTDTVPTGNDKTKTAGTSSRQTQEISTKHTPGPELPGARKNEEATPEKQQFKKENKVTRIQFEPATIFNQQPPYHYPYICMPRKDSPCRKPRKARSGRIGREENRFGRYLHQYFSGNTIVSDDKSLVLGNRMLSPDFCITYDPDGKNITIVIEIDEPYEGIPDIAKRKPIHFLDCGDERNNLDYTNRGWVVIRFAEVQVVQSADACCLAIAALLRALDPLYSFSHALSVITPLSPLKLWTEQEALAMSKARYREQYLGITNFGFTAEQTTEMPTLTEEEKAIEELIEDKVEDEIPGKPAHKVNPVAVAKEPGKKVSLAATIGEETKPVPWKSIEEISRVKELSKPRQFPEKIDLEVGKTAQKNTLQKKNEVPKEKPPLVLPVGARKEELIQWAIDNEIWLNFVFQDAQKHKITNYEPRFISNNIITGYNHVEKRLIEYYIPLITNITLVY